MLNLYYLSTYRYSASMILSLVLSKARILHAHIHTSHTPTFNFTPPYKPKISRVKSIKNKPFPHSNPNQ